jgi:hypothetical protein
MPNPQCVPHLLFFHPTLPAFIPSSVMKIAEGIVKKGDIAQVAPHFGHLTFVPFDTSAHPKAHTTKIATSKKILYLFAHFFIQLTSLQRYTGSGSMLAIWRRTTKLIVREIQR